MGNFFRVASFLVIMVLASCKDKEARTIMTVNGPVPVSNMGVTLTHEHILVTFIGADSIKYAVWDNDKVSAKVLPFLREIKSRGCRTFIECTPEYLGRDPLLLKSLSDVTGLNIITNTGYYGAMNNKYLPKHAFTESADQIASRWTDEWEKGIDGTNIRPGFIKIGISGDTLSEVHRKLVIAAARTHLKTGMTIASHTGPSLPAFEQMAILKKEGVAPEAFIWVHAQAEKDPENRIKAARMGAWVSLDGLNGDNTEDYVKMLKDMKANSLLNKVLLSHDAGWYDPEKEDGGQFRGYTALFDKLIPRLSKEKFTMNEIRLIIEMNPSEAFAICVRKTD